MRETRTWAMDTISMRARADGLHFRGHAAVFDQRTWIGPPKFGFWEEVAASAFDRAIEEDDVRFLVDHDPGKVLARNTAGTLRLTKDKRGLVADADMADVSYARDLAVLLERGDVSQMSFGFVPRVEEWATLDSGEEVRRLVDVELFDVSAVAYPAYEGTDAAMRACEARRADHRTNQLATLRRRLDAAWKGES